MYILDIQRHLAIPISQMAAADGLGIGVQMLTGNISFFRNIDSIGHFEGQSIFLYVPRLRLSPDTSCVHTERP